MTFFDMNLTYNELIRRHEVYNGYEYINVGKDLSYDALLLQLRYKDKEIHYISKNPIKLIIDNKLKFKKNEILKNKSLTGEFICIDKKVKFKIIEEELDNGMKVNITIDRCGDISKCEMQKIARSLEAFMLGIDLTNEIELNEYMEYLYEDQFNKLNLNNYQSNIDEDEDEDEDGDEDKNKDTNLEVVNLQDPILEDNILDNINDKKYDLI